MKKKKVFQKQLTFLSSRLLKSFMILLMTFCLSNTSSAQTKMPTAKMDEAGKIELDGRSPIVYSYQMDFKNMGFKTEEGAVKYFKRGNSPHSTFMVDFKRQIVQIDIEYRLKPSWTHEDWNRFLTNQLKSEVKK